MRGHRIVIPPELIAEGKRLYEQTDTPIPLIARHLGISRATLQYRIDEWKWTRRRYAAPGAIAEPIGAATPEADTAAAPTDAPPAERAPLPFAERMARVLDAEMAVIERTLKMLGPASSAEAERTTRILAMISRTVQEIQASAEGQTSSDETDDDAVPGDIDEFREELACRIRAFVEAKRGGTGGAGGDAAG